MDLNNLIHVYNYFYDSFPIKNSQVNHINVRKEFSILEYTFSIFYKNQLIFYLSIHFLSVCLYKLSINYCIQRSYACTQLI